MLFDDVFLTIALVLGVAVALGAVGQRLRIPLIITFLATGILAGPGGLGLFGSNSNFELLAQIGVALLLFIVGLKLDLNLIKSIGPVALATGLGQIVFTSLIGFVITLSLGLSIVSAAYVSVALTFSSTIIIVKLLSDKKEIESLHGQIALGFLIVQDIVAIIALVTLTTIGADLSQGALPVLNYLIIAGKGVGFLLVAIVLGKYVIPRLSSRMAQSPELLSLFAISWAIILGSAGEVLGFTKEVGAFIAGVTLASTEYRNAISARLTGVRDFLLIFFFIGFGTYLDWSVIGSKVLIALVLSLFVLVGNPLIVIMIMGLMGYRRRTGFMAGLTVAQISEFSLVVATLGLSLGHISRQTVGIITFVGLVTIFASTYMILYSEKLYKLLSGPLRVFERKDPYREAALDTLKGSPRADVILIGLGNYGSGIAESLLRRKKRIIGLDHDPGVSKLWKKKGVTVLYGDVADEEIYDNLPLNSVDWIVSTVRVREPNLVMLDHLKARSFKGGVALTATNKKEARLYEKKGAKLVFYPFRDASEHAVDALTTAMDIIPDDLGCYFSSKEVRVGRWPGPSGVRIKDMDLRSMTGVSIIAVRRGDMLMNDPPSDFRVIPGDSLVLVGLPDRIELSERLLAELKFTDSSELFKKFHVANVPVKDNRFLSGKSLIQLEFKKRFNLNVLGMIDVEGRITVPEAGRELNYDDILVVIGRKEQLNRFRTGPQRCF